MILLRRFSSYQLRPYQQECIDKSLDAFKGGIQRVAVSLPVGSGKTIILVNLLKNLPNPKPDATKVLVLAHRTELLHQPYLHMKKWCPELKVGLEQGTVTYSPFDQVIIASVATLGRKNSPRLKSLNPTEFKAILIDEAHHASADTYQRILEHFNCYEQESHIKVWGCSATLRRHDGIALAPTFQNVVYEKELQSMIDESWLCKFEVERVHTGVDISKVKMTGNDYNVKSLSKAVNSDERNTAILKVYKEGALAKNRKATIIFAVDVSHIKNIVSLFQAEGIDCRGLDGETDTRSRQEILSEFRDGKFPVLVNCGILTEGTDIPRVDCIFMARPTKSPGLLMQMVGRGLRNFENKDFCIVYDFVDVIDDSKLELASLPTLCGLDQSTCKKNENEKRYQSQAAPKETTLQTAPVDGIQVSFSRISILEPYGTRSSEGKSRSHSLSPFFWIKLNEDMFVLRTHKFEIRINRDRAFKMFIVSKDEKSLKSQVLFRHDNLISAMNAADTFIKSKHSFHELKLFRRDAKWRKFPATEQQIAWLQKHYKGEIHGNLTKGEAAILMTKLIHAQKEKNPLKSYYRSKAQAN